MNKFPPGWNEARIKQTIERYDNLDDDGWLAEYEAALQREGETLIAVPTELVPAVHELIRRHGQTATGPV
jgi:hypothetical protein